jgi:hypothetical protein
MLPLSSFISIHKFHIKYCYQIRLLLSLLCSLFLFSSFFWLIQDLPGALDDAAVTEALELHKIKNRQWAIFKTSAIKGEGLFEGLDW